MSPLCHRDGGLGNKIVLLSFNYFTLAVMNRFSSESREWLWFFFLMIAEGCVEHSGTRNVSRRRIYYNFYALFGFIVTIFAKNNYQWWDVLPLISQRHRAWHRARIKNHHVFSTTLLECRQKSAFNYRGNDKRFSRM